MGMQGTNFSLVSSCPPQMSSMDQALMQMGHPAAPAPAPQMYSYEQPNGLPGSRATLSRQMLSQVRK